MLMKTIVIAGLSVLISSCSNEPFHDDPPSYKVCKGFGCSTSPNKVPSRAETHKPTKEEKIRVRRGEAPDFGSEEISVGGTFPF